MRRARRALTALSVDGHLEVAAPAVAKLDAPWTLVVFSDATPSIEAHDLARFLWEMHQLIPDLSDNVIVDQAIGHRRAKTKPGCCTHSRLHRKAVLKGVSDPGI